MKVPIGLNFSTRLFVGSTTTTLSEAPIARSSGVVVVGPNCPSPVPALPHLVTKAPEEVNSWIRLLPESATYRLLDESTAMPVGVANWPFPLPALPHAVTKAPDELNFWIWLPSLSTT